MLLTRIGYGIINEGPWLLYITCNSYVYLTLAFRETCRTPFVFDVVVCLFLH